VRLYAYTCVVAVLLAGCESERIGRSAARPDASDDAGLADAGNPTRDAASEDAETGDAELGDAQAGDARIKDAEPIDATIEDATIRDADVADAALTDGAAVPPLPGDLLLTDKADNGIYLIDGTGNVRTFWPSPIAGISGVTVDRRTNDRFWIAGSGNSAPTFFALDWSGAVVETMQFEALFSVTKEGLKSLDLAMPSETLVTLFRNYNDVDSVDGVIFPTGARPWATGLNLEIGFWGVHVETLGADVQNTLDIWVTRDTPALQRWGWAGNAPTASIALPAGSEPRGVTRIPAGDFFIVDAAQDRILRLTPAGTIITTIATPGSEPADISYFE
jgi:hypothetical protein